MRGIFLALLFLLAGCAGLLSFLESMPFGEAVYFTLITGLTVGYGDIVPVTVSGRILSIATGFIGFILFGLIIAIATHSLGQVAQEIRSRGQDRK